MMNNVSKPFYSCSQNWWCSSRSCRKYPEDRVSVDLKQRRQPSQTVFQSHIRRCRISITMVGDCYKNHLPCLALQASKNKTCSFSWFNLTNLCHRILSHVQVSISSRWSTCGTALCGLFSILRRTSPWSPPSLMAAKGKSLTHCHVLSIKL